MGMTQIREMVSETRSEIETVAGMSDEQKKKLDSQLKAIEKRLEVPNTQVYRLAVYSIAAVVLLLVIGSIGLAIPPGGKGEIPDFFAVTIGTAVGALAGMLVPTAQ